MVIQHEQGFKQSTDWKSNRGLMPSPPNGVKMTDYQVIPEIDVLIATGHFLAQRGLQLDQFSVPRGKGMDTKSAKNRIFRTFCSTPGFVSYFVNEGPDIIGASETEWWQIECKGSGSGKQQTQRNNFDRALASVVSYYGEDVKQLPESCIIAQAYLGLALPASPAYLNELKRRVRQPLRKILNMWVLLYEPKSEKVRAVSPDDSY